MLAAWQNSRSLLIKLFRLKGFVFYAKQLKSNLILFWNKQCLRFRIIVLVLKPKPVIVGSFFSDKGGVSTHIINIKRYSKNKVDTLPDAKSLKLIEVANLKTFYKSKIESKHIKFKLVHSHVDPWFIKFCERCHANGVRWVHTYHTVYFKHDWDGGLKPWQKEINTTLIEEACKADIKISVSLWLQDYLRSRHQIETIYIPNGVDVKKCERADANRFKDKFGIKDEFILFAGGLDDIKNPLDFIKLAMAIPNFEFVMVGRDATNDKIKSKYNLDIPENLTALGLMAHDHLLNAIDACKVFVVTSKSEGLPTVLMEAMALERSVVGVNTFGTKEVIHSDAYGYLYEPGNLDDLIAKTQQAYQHSKGPQARQRILEAYDWRVIAPQLDNIYQELLNGKV